MQKKIKNQNMSIFEGRLKDLTIAFVQFGCDKNRVNGEKVLAKLQNYGFSFTDNIALADIIIVNTCGFIKSARKECLKAIKEYSKLKKFNCQKLIVMGCMAQKFFDEITDEIVGVDAFVRLNGNNNIINIIESLYSVESGYNCELLNYERVLSTPANYAYLMIADGCNNYCTYCTIPYIRGKYKSIEIEKIIEEAQELVKKGVSELILVAQDVTRYGKDIYDEYKIVELIQKLSLIEGVHWIRLHYCYPELVSDELINEIVNNDKVCKYIDIPLQHISDHILRDMNRRSTKRSTEELIQKIQKQAVKISIRSTFMLGFPGETKEDVSELIKFLEKYKLDNVGFFAYSREKHTKSYDFKNQVSLITKNARLKTLQLVQYKIMFNHNLQMINETVEAVVQEKLDDITYKCRTEYNSPDVDTYVYVTTRKKLKIGDYHTVKICGVINEDLKGEML